MNLQSNDGLLNRVLELIKVSTQSKKKMHHLLQFSHSGSTIIPKKNKIPTVYAAN